MTIVSPVAADAASAAEIEKYAAAVALQLVAEPWPSLLSTTRFAAAAGTATNTVSIAAQNAVRIETFILDSPGGWIWLKSRARDGNSTVEVTRCQGSYVSAALWSV